MKWRLRKWLCWLQWIMDGKPNLMYLGFHCGCCGKWTDETLYVPTYQSLGEWWDTWGICHKCRADTFMLEE